jgi:hypothetical protein
MQTNKDYIVCFREVGFQMTPAGSGFKSRFAEQFIQPETPTLSSDVTDKEEEEETPGKVEDESTAKDTDPMVLPYIYVQNLNARRYTGYFPDSTVQYKVELKNGFKDGSYTEYYQNGEVKMTGDFKGDKRDGVWKLYNEKGKMVLRRTYDKGGVVREKGRD